MQKYISFIFLFLVFILGNKDTYSQCGQLKKRTYASRQNFKGEGVIGIFPGTIINPSDAINGDLQNFSTLNVPIGINISLPWPLTGLIELKSSATQFLEFKNGTNYIPAHTPAIIKLKLPVSLLGVLNNIEIQPFKDLSGTTNNGNATAVGPAFSTATLVNALNGNGDVEIVVTPTQDYQGVWIRLGSTLGLALSLDIYEAYIMENDTSSGINCDAPIDVLSGVRAGTAIGGIANATGSVSYPWKAIDNDPNSFATLSVGAQLLSEVFGTVIFNSPSQPNDVVEIILQKADGGLLDLDLLTGFTIQAYNGTTAVGPPINSSSTGLGLKLLSGTSGNAKYLLRARINQVFDRIEIKMGGLANIEFTDLKIYDVSRKISPDILVNNSTPSTLSAICEGESVVLSVDDPQSCTEYSWYDVASGGTPLATGTSYTISNLSSDKTYYVEAARKNACNNISERVPADITVKAAPSISLGTIPEVCLKNNMAIIPFGTPINFPESYKIIWNQEALDANFIDIEQNLPSNNEINIAIPPDTNPGTYIGSLTVKNSNGCYSYPAQAIQIVIKPQPEAPELIIQTHSQY